jgi:two-component system, cell cycle sensor histidine kinase and response regulator CckA
MAAPRRTPPAGNAPLILLVDDEPDVRTIVGLMLEDLGYAVVTAAGGLEALRQFAERPEAIAAVVLDYSMPDLNGVQTYRELARVRPDVRVLLSSGFGEMETLGELSDRATLGFIQKPYSLSDLKKKLALLLTV